MAASTATANTSVILVSSIGTKVYLSSVAYPGHIVTIKDYAGVASQGNPIVVSTTKDIYFADGAISTLLYNPYSYLTVSSKTPTTWQILNNVGFLTTLSNAFVNQLTVGNAYIELTSSVKEYVSSATANAVAITKSLALTGEVSILGDITVSGVVDIFSSLRVKEDIFLSSGLTVQGSATLQSTVSVNGDIQVYGNISTTGNLIVQDDLFISSSLYSDSALVPKYLSVQTLTMNTINVAGDFRTEHSMSVNSNLLLRDSLNTISSGVVLSSITVLKETKIVDDLTIRKAFTTQMLDVYSSGTVVKEISARSLETFGILSTGNSLLVGNTITVGESTLVEKVVLLGDVRTNSLAVSGNANISSLTFQGNLTVGGSTSLFSSFHTSSLTGGSGIVGGSLTVGDHTSVSTFFSTLSDMSVGGSLLALGFCNIQVNENSYVEQSVEAGMVGIYGGVSTHSLYVSQNLFVDGDISIAGTVKANVVGAPIELIMSTLNLSNRFTVSNTGYIPLLEATSNTSNRFPMAILAGEGATIDSIQTLTYISANPEINIRDTLEDENPGKIDPDTKTISSLRVSTLYNTAVLSSFVVGAGTYINPLIDLSGYLLFGTPDTYKFLPGSSGVFTTSLSFTGGGNGGYYNAHAAPSQPVWVAVGKDTTQSKTIQYSLDGVSWNPAKTGGFAIIPFPTSAGTGRDVTYMSTTFNNAYTPKWIAIGTGWPGYPSLQWSPDGMNWAPGAGSVFPVGFAANRLLYFPSPVNPNDGGVTLAGGFGGPGNFGVRYTNDGINWLQATAAYGSGEFIVRDFTVDGNYNILAVGQNSFNTNNMYIAGPSNFASGWSNLSNLPVMPGTYNTISYGNGFYVLGTTATSGNPLTSIWKSLNLGVWTSITSGGFTVATNRITYDSYTSSFFAVGKTGGDSNLQYSFDGSHWFSVDTTFPSAVSSIAQGTLLLPDNQSRFFTVNTEARFETAVSSVLLNASTVIASSFTATYFEGDASQIVEINKFSTRMGVSSILTQYIGMYSTTVYYDSTFTSTATIASQLNLSGNNFTSTISFWVAAGLNSESNANMIDSKTIQSWVGSSNTSFEYYGSAVAGNNLSNNPFFVATGADSRTSYTIQYSRDGIYWNPISNGGFTALDSNGFKTGNTVAYGHFYSTIPSGYTLRPRWVVGGYGGGTASTVFYSDDGIQFATAIGTSDTLSTSVLKIKTANNYAVGLNTSNLIINSSNAVNWNTANFGTAITGFGYGYSPSYLLGWYGFDSNGNVYFSSDNGSNWSYTTNIPSMTDIRDMSYTTNDANGYWIAIGSNSMYLTSSPTTSWSMVGAFLNQGLTQFQSLWYDSNQTRWFAGGEAQASIKTLWTSTDGIQWDSIVSGGFSSATLGYGVGYAVLRTSSIVLAAGKGAFTPLTQTKPQILEVIGATWPPSPSIYTSTILTQSNTSNIFSSAIYGLAFTSSPTQTYPFIAVGDGTTPQKTIARSSNLSEWIPAIAGGFSPAAYGAIYYSTADIWVAVGDSIASTATIQYSPDGANWFATNRSGSLPLGGRGITKFRDTSARYNRLVAVGKAPFRTTYGYNNTIAYSDDGFTWSNAGLNNGFQYAGYGVGAGIVAGLEGVVAVGTAYTTDPSTILSEAASIQISFDGITWYDTTGGFDVAGYGVASHGSLWVAVGENTTYGTTYTVPFGAAPQTIKYSTDAAHWYNANNSFVYAGYGVTYDSNNNVFVAVGKSTSNTFSILYSGDGQTWNTLQSTNSGFLSQQAFGTAFGVFGQLMNITEQTPLLDFPKLTVYARNESLNYQTPSLRLLSTSLIFNETLSVNLSSQVMINTLTPVGSNTLTVIGNVETSTLYYRGTEPTYFNSIVSSLTVSSLLFTNVMTGTELITPSWGYNISTLANTIRIEQRNTSFYTNINDTLFIKKATYLSPGVGINTSTPSEMLDINGNFACSTISTAIYKQTFIEFDTPAREYITSPTISIYEGSNPYATSGKNTIYSEPSSITFNSILSINLSTQRVGCYTNNPQFDFDVQRAGWISTLTTQKINTKTLFFTLQSL